MKKILSNTYINILLFILINLGFSSITKNINNINEFVLMLMDFILCLILISIFAYFYSKIEWSSKKIFYEMLLISISGSFFIAFYNYVYFDIINPNEIKELLNQTEQEMINAGYSSNEINQTMRLSSNFTTPIVIAITSFLGYSFSSVVSSIICGKYFSQKLNGTT